MGGECRVLRTVQALRVFQAKTHAHASVATLTVEDCALIPLSRTSHTSHPRRP